jgi:hypothetical protein
MDAVFGLLSGLAVWDSTDLLTWRLQGSSIDRSIGLPMRPENLREGKTGWKQGLPPPDNVARESPACATDPAPTVPATLMSGEPIAIPFSRGCGTSSQLCPWFTGVAGGALLAD